MIKLFMVISIIIHIITLIVIVYLYKQFQLLQDLNLPNVKELLEKTLVSIKEENKQLQQTLNDMTTKKQTKQMTKTKANISQPLSINHVQPTPTFDQTLTADDPTDEQSLLAVEVEDKYEPSLHGQIFQLHEKGLSNEEIAQALNCGKTEVDLILRFQQNK